MTPERNISGAAGETADIMRDRYLDKETEAVYQAYSEFLDAAKFPYSNNQNGFHVYLEMKHIRRSFTQVSEVWNGEILITDYCGNCYTGVRKANRVAKAIREKFPDHEISVEHYGASFEIEVYYQIRFTTIEALHEAVLSVAEVADEGARIGYEMLGDEEFER